MTIRRIERQSAGVWRAVFLDGPLGNWGGPLCLCLKHGGKVSNVSVLLLWDGLSDWFFRKCLLNHNVSAAAATKLAGSDMERQDQKTEPKDISQ